MGGLWCLIQLSFASLCLSVSNSSFTSFPPPSRNATVAQMIEQFIVLFQKQTELGFIYLKVGTYLRGVDSDIAWWTNHVARSQREGNNGRGASRSRGSSQTSSQTCWAGKD